MSEDEQISAPLPGIDDSTGAAVAVKLLDPVEKKAEEKPVRPPYIPKKIFVCCDGTGNEFKASPPQDTDTDGNSNVVKFYTALDLGPGQFAYYHPGVGTMGDPSKKGFSRWWSKVKGLAFGYGFQDNVLDAYRYLMQHYNSGDTVYILGFSRGAYTARALAGFLHGYGLLCRGNEGHILYAWGMYTAKLQSEREEDDPNHTLETDFAFRDTFSHADFMMHFVGLWDTVSSVGWITTPLRLLHLAQNPSIIIGRHAVSIDERRCFYHDNLWGSPVAIQVPPVLRNPKDPTALGKPQDLIQVWFPGVHSDVGGSYGQCSSGLANGSLEWMIEQAQDAGAYFNPRRMEAVLGKEVTCDPQGRTAELQKLYPEPTSWVIHISLKGLWWILEAFPHRYYNTDSDPKEVLRIPWGAWRRLPDGALLHPEVIARLADPSKGYDPPNLRCGKITASSIAGSQKYGLFLAPKPKVDWRQNWLLVFLVKTVLTAVPVVASRPLMLWLWSLGERALPQRLGEMARPLRQWLLEPVWVLKLGACLGHFAGALTWSIAAAAVIVLTWTLIRLKWPRS